MLYSFNQQDNTQTPLIDIPVVREINTTKCIQRCDIKLNVKPGSASMSFIVLVYTVGTLFRGKHISPLCLIKCPKHSIMSSSSTTVIHRKRQLVDQAKLPTNYPNQINISGTTTKKYHTCTTHFYTCLFHYNFRLRADMVFFAPVLHKHQDLLTSNSLSIL